MTATTTPPTTSIDTVHDNAWQRMLGDAPDDARAAFLETRTTIRNAVVAELAVRRDISASTHLTAEGKAKAFKDLEQRPRTVLHSIAALDTQVTDLAAEIKGAEVAAERGFVRSGSSGYSAPKEEPRTPDQISAEREIRDHLRALPAHEVRARYIAAVTSGDDPELVRAIELAPKSFPLLDASTTGEVRKWRIDNSPLAPHIRALRGRRDAIEYLAFCAKRDLGVE